MGIENVERDWARCINCGHYQQSRNYPLAELEKIYKDGYRDFRFRGETINQSYNRVIGTPHNENSQRCEWFIGNIGEVKTILDFGSGLGVFPEYLSNRGYSVDCVETNKDSQAFIKNEIKLPCYEEIPGKQYDVISLVHVLEHIEKPEDFLPLWCEQSPLLNTDKLFIEVPDAIEFELLDKNHDEFNSCHCHFFTPENLEKLLNKCGYQVLEMQDVHYKDRNLSRIMMICS